MAANQDAAAESPSESSLENSEKIDDLEWGDESIEFSFAHFEHHWRLYLINFERQRLRYAGICCGHKEVLYGLDVDLFAEDMQSMIFQDTIKAAASCMYETPFIINNNNYKAPEPRGFKPEPEPEPKPKPKAKPSPEPETKPRTTS